MSRKEIYEIGEVPPIGHVPKHMYAQLIRAERFGEPKQAFKVEKVDVPEIRPDEVLDELARREGMSGLVEKASRKDET